ncbi:unnamed protein product [Gulo gulo]|uniref:Uncharacterized protein n=1 Tax=Gulo gulo TaxID=48420 RepID=A0A9X9PTN8_GULGU|nr:unnamed protein product [Gulo gulo]
MSQLPGLLPVHAPNVLLFLFYCYYFLNNFLNIQLATM